MYLTGPRQSGKSTLARAIAEERGMEYFTLDDAALLAAARSDPQGLLASQRGPLVLDEFQMAPELIGAIKMISDKAGGKKGIFLLTGSSDIFRSAKVQEALPGHLARIEVKASMTVKPGDFSGLTHFSEYAKERLLRGILYYSGDKVLPFRIKEAIFRAVPIATLMGVSGAYALI